MGVVPYGTIIALIPAVVISYTSGGLASASIVAMAYLIINQFENFLFAPIIIEKVVGLSPLVIILAAIIGFELSSFWGLILAIPTAVFVMELMSDLEKKKIILRSKIT
jgi:predicted PurR-regulated permease PerM